MIYLIYNAIDLFFEAKEKKKQAKKIGRKQKYKIIKKNMFVICPYINPTI
jgi:hypothetical protein